MLTATHFANVVACEACSPPAHFGLLRDGGENVPQPGYVGDRYERSRVLIVAQNPASPSPHLAEADRRYTARLRALRDDPTEENFGAVCEELEEFVPTWGIHRAFPLAECGLELRDIAFFNLVRCRTAALGAPGNGAVAHCVDRHFNRWVEALSPRVVVFIGKWASDRAAASVGARKIPNGFINRQKSLTTAQRQEDRARAVSLVRTSIGLGHSPTR